MSCFIDIDLFNNSYYYDFNVEMEDSHSLFSANSIVYQQRGRITIFKVSTTCTNFSYYTRYSFAANCTWLSQLQSSHAMDEKCFTCHSMFKKRPKGYQRKLISTFVKGLQKRFKRHCWGKLWDRCSQISIFVWRMFQSVHKNGKIKSKIT